MSIRNALIEMLQSAREGERRFVARLPASELDEPGMPSRWAAGPLLAHVTEFKEQQVVRVESVLHGKEAPDFVTVDHLDPAVYAWYQVQPWDEVLAAAERVSAALVACTSELDEDTLTEPGKLPFLRGRMLWSQLLVRGVWHSSGHLGPYLAEHGRADEAVALQQRLVDRARALTLPATPGSWAMGIYNLACAQVAAGRLDEGRESLEQAVGLDSALAESAETDPDLEPLRAAV